MHKQRLLASVAVAAILAVPGRADTTIDSETKTAQTTGALLSGGAGTANVGNLTIDSDGSVVISKSSIGAVTIDSSHWLYSNGAIKNTGESTAYGIHVDVSSNPDLSGASFTNASSSTITGAGIYLDSSATVVLTGDGSSKTAIYFDTSGGAGTYTGDLTINGAAITVDGSSSYGFYFGSDTTFNGDLNLTSGSLTLNDSASTGLYFAGDTTINGDLTIGSGFAITMSDNTNTGLQLAADSVFNGDLTLGGTITMHQTTARSTTASSLIGVLMQGEFNGDVTLSSTGSIYVIGAGSRGMSIEGDGITGGALTITGAITTTGYSSSYDSSSSYSSISTYPEAGTALSISADITNGVMISGAAYSGASSSTGSITANGTSAALAINPSLNTSVSQTAPLVIGVYKYNGEYDTYDPGFSFYNRGSITAQPMNYNATALGIYMVGSEAYHTVLTGGFYNSGTISATATTNDDSGSAASATAIYIGSYTYLDNATFDTVTGTWADSTLTSKVSSDQAAFVNAAKGGSGVISAAVSGYGAGLARAIYIDQYASVPSLINTGSITASATTTDKELTTKISGSSYSLYAAAITDVSGTLTSIYNTGTIAAYAGVKTSSSTTITDLDSDLQRAVAIDLSSGNTLTPSGSGVTITERATATSSATIIGDIIFGTGDHQVIDIQGASSTYTASIYGDIYYGATGTNAIAHELNVGAYGIVKGKVTAGSGPGVAVTVASNGVLALDNDTTALNAASVSVADSGTLSLGVSNDLSSDGVIDAKGTVVLAKGSNLNLTYNSFVAQGSNDFTLISTSTGALSIDANTLATTNEDLQTNVSAGGTLPYLFKSASLEVTSTSSGDKLLLHVLPKTSTELGLTGYAAQIFPYANSALVNDDTLGSAMIYGVKNAKEAQTAYEAFVPNVTGGTRASAIAITDQATGPVAARQRNLLMFARGEAGSSIWATEFVQQIKDPGTGDTSNAGTRALAGFKDNGFGLAVGMDSGNAKNGWYGGAITFYAGDSGELKRYSKTHEQWLLLSGYSVWRGKGLFFNSKLDIGYGKFDGKRSITLTLSEADATTTSIYTRTAENKHEGALLSGGFSTGTYVNYGALTLSPTLSVDALVMRENGYTESNPGTATTGDAFDLKVEPYYAKSLRAFLGVDMRYDVDMGDFLLQPEFRGGYRYDFLTDPVKLKAAFAYADVSGSTAAPGTQFTITGPDPAKGSFVLGGSLAATTNDWTIGLHYDYVKGSNGMLQQIGTLNVTGRL